MGLSLLGLGLLRSEEGVVVVVGGEKGYDLDRMAHCGWLQSGRGGVVCKVVEGDEDVVIVVVGGLGVAAWRICMVVAVVFVKAIPL